MSEAVTSAGTSLGCYADEVLASDYSGCAVRLLSARVIQSTCSDATLRKEAL